MPGQYKIRIHKDTGVASGIPPFWFWNVDFGSLTAQNVAFTKKGAKRAAIRYIANREKSIRQKGEEMVYEINI